MDEMQEVNDLIESGEYTATAHLSSIDHAAGVAEAVAEQAAAPLVHPSDNHPHAKERRGTYGGTVIDWLF